MAFDRNKAFDIRDDGILFDNGVHLSSGPLDPSHSAVDGDLFFQTNGVLWRYLSGWKVYDFKVDLVTTSIQTNATVTPTNITQLTSPSLMIGTYRYTALLRLQSTATTNGMGFRMSQGTATISQVSGKFSTTVSLTGVNRNNDYDQVLLANNFFTTSAPVANVDFLANIVGSFQISAAGTVALQFRSEGAVASSVRPGSVLSIERVL